MLIVQKFGGSSLADPERLRRAAQIILAEKRSHSQLLAVVSAAGDTTDDLSGKAKELCACPDLRELDALLACGEQQSAAYLAMLLRSMGADALSLTGWQAGILTSAAYGNADIVKIIPYKIKKALSRGKIVIVSGFQGLSPEADICTLGRGGSDTTAVALAAALKADECRIYTDVNGIYTADPRLIGSAKLLEKVDMRDMLSLSRCGSQVLKDKSVALAMEKRMKLRVLSSFEPSVGTELCVLSEDERPDFTGLTRSEENSTLSAVGKKASQESLSLLSAALRERDISVESAELRDNCISLKVAREQLIPAMELCHCLLFE